MEREAEGIIRKGLKRRILFAFDLPFAPNRGGVERVSLLLARQFLKEGHEIAFLSLEKEGDDNFEKIESARYFYLDGEPTEKRSQLNKIIIEESIDIIINQTRSLEMISLLNNVKAAGVKVVSVVHNQPFSTYGKEREIKRLLKPDTLKGHILKGLTMIWPEIYRKERTKFDRRQLKGLLDVSDKILLLSERYIPRIQKLMPEADPKKFDAINNPNTFTIPSATPQKENIMLFVGRLSEPQKNIKGFINVWNKFYKKHPDWKALIVGDGPYQESMERYAKKRGSKNLYFEGNRREVASYYSRAKLLVMTSMYEGWPMVLGEAMAYECVPLVFDTFEAAQDMVIDGKTGSLIPGMDTEVLAEAASILAQNDSLRKKIAHQAKIHIHNFEIEKIAEQWKGIIDE